MSSIYYLYATWKGSNFFSIIVALLFASFQSVLDPTCWKLEVTFFFINLDSDMLQKSLHCICYCMLSTGCLCVGSYFFFKIIVELCFEIFTKLKYLIYYKYTLFYNFWVIPVVLSSGMISLYSGIILSFCLF